METNVMPYSGVAMEGESSPPSRVELPLARGFSVETSGSQNPALGLVCQATVLPPWLSFSFLRRHGAGTVRKERARC